MSRPIELYKDAPYDQGLMEYVRSGRAEPLEGVDDDQNWREDTIPCYIYRATRQRFAPTESAFEINIKLRLESVTFTFPRFTLQALCRNFDRLLESTEGIVVIYGVPYQTILNIPHYNAATVELFLLAIKFAQYKYRHPYRVMWADDEMPFIDEDAPSDDKTMHTSVFRLAEWLGCKAVMDYTAEKIRRVIAKELIRDAPIQVAHYLDLFEQIQLSVKAEPIQKLLGTAIILSYPSIKRTLQEEDLKDFINSDVSPQFQELWRDMWAYNNNHKCLPWKMVSADAAATFSPATEETDSGIESQTSPPTLSVRLNKRKQSSSSSLEPAQLPGGSRIPCYEAPLIQVQFPQRLLRRSSQLSLEGSEEEYEDGTSPKRAKTTIASGSTGSSTDQEQIGAGTQSGEDAND